MRSIIYTLYHARFYFEHVVVIVVVSFAFFPQLIYYVVNPKAAVVWENHLKVDSEFGSTLRRKYAFETVKNQNKLTHFELSKN